ncbi:MAG: histidine phosphatase family protein [Gaiellaceae bacterium]
MPTRIILARHGETDWNLERRWQGHSDRPLNETGRAQAEELAEQLAGEPIAAVYSSDLVRAHETARIVAARLGLDVVAVPGLRERRFGSWEGLRDVEVEHRFPDAHGPPDGETREEMLRRVLESLEAIAAAHAGETVLVVCHGGPIRAALLHHAHPLSEERAGNCSVFDLEVD